MNILFIDDTEQMSGRYIAVGGVIFHDEYIRNLFTAFRELKTRHGIPLEEEVKWSPGKGSGTFQRLRREERVSPYSDFLDLLGRFNGTAIVAVVRKDMTSYDATTAKWKCIEFATERFQYFLQAQEDKNGIILADFPGSGKEEKRLLGNYYRFLDEGTDYVRPSNVVMNLLTTESHLNPGLQMADLVVGVTASMCTPTPHHSSKLLWNKIARNLHRSANGSAAGSGLKIFPRECAKDTYQRLLPQHLEAPEYSDSEEAREGLRRLYSQVMSEDELDMHFPRF